MESLQALLNVYNFLLYIEEVSHITSFSYVRGRAHTHTHKPAKTLVYGVGVYSIARAEFED